MVGIVSRANLLQALASLSKQVEVVPEVNDSQIRDKVLTQLNAEPWTRPSLVNVIVQDGTVELWGIVESASERKLSESLPRSPPACAPSMTISSFVRRSGDIERRTLISLKVPSTAGFAVVKRTPQQKMLALKRGSSGASLKGSWFLR